MPSDQAADLRRLMRQARLPQTFDAGRSPLIWAVTSGKGGVGVTTLAVNLAVAWGLSGRRTVLVDANLDGPDASALCGAFDGPGLLDVLAGERSIHEVLRLGPGGIQLLPGQWADDRKVGAAADYVNGDYDRLLRELRGLGQHADVVVLDVGSGQSRLARRFWQAADGVLLVTSPDALSIVNSYAAVKLLRPAAGTLICTAVNFSEDEAAAEVHARLARSCHRFLGQTLIAAGELPFDRRIAAAGASRTPFVLERRGDRLARRVDGLAETLLSLCPASGRMGAHDALPFDLAVS